MIYSPIEADYHIDQINQEDQQVKDQDILKDHHLRNLSHNLLQQLDLKTNQLNQHQQDMRLLEERHSKEFLNIETNISQ